MWRGATRGTPCGAGAHIVQVGRSLLGDVEDALELNLALGAEVRVRQRLLVSLRAAGNLLDRRLQLLWRQDATKQFKSIVLQICASFVGGITIWRTTVDLQILLDHYCMH